MKRYGMVAFLLAAMLAGSLPAQAERREGGAAEAMHKAQIMIRKLSMEKTALQTESAKLTTQVNELETKLEDLQTDLDKNHKKLASAEKNNHHLVDRITNDTDQFRKLLKKYKDVSQTLRNAMQDNTLLVNAVQERTHWVEQCRTQNERMFKAGLELLDRYKNKTVAEVIKGKEPVLGLGRVELENAVQDYRFRLEDLTVTPFQASAPLPSQASNIR